MTVNEALILMNEKADEAEKIFCAHGISVSREVRYMNSVFAELESQKGAKYVSVTLDALNGVVSTHFPGINGVELTPVK